MHTDLQRLAANNYVLAGMALAAVLLAGVLVQAGAVSTGTQQSASLAYDGGRPAAAGDGLVARESGHEDDRERKRVTRVRMDIDVADVQQAQTGIETLTGKYHGFVEGRSFRREFGGQGRMTVRVPAANRTAFTTAVADRYTVESRETDVRDVTRRYTELSLELKNKRQELRRLEQLMNRTDEVDNLIKIQERMGELRTRIQSLEHQKQELENQVEYATVTITLEEARAFETRFELRRAVTDAYRGAFNSINLMIVGTGYLMPFALLFAALYLLKRWWESR